MRPQGRVLVFCPPGRLFLATLVLSSWRDVSEFVLADDECSELDIESFSAAIVMDRFVTRERVVRLVAKTHVFVLAWNGLFEIRGYCELLGADADVTYVGTDDEVPLAATTSRIDYLPMIDRDCPYIGWRERFRKKTRFEAIGSSSYRGQWYRTQLSASRWWRLLVASGGALLNRPRTLRKTFESGFVAERLVWAGNCHFDIASLDLPVAIRDSINARVLSVRRVAGAEERLGAALQLIDEWRAVAEGSLGRARANETTYVTNTLLRWAFLDFFMKTGAEATWFFGQDNLGLGLQFELYVYNLVSNHRVAFLDFGGKTSTSLLYPRSLHLLARQCYVVPLVLPDLGDSRDGMLDAAHRIRQGLGDKRAFFGALEQRRQRLYDETSSNSSLADLQHHVWHDFSSS